ncbi:MAG: Bcr/CflA family efflux MFS transporter [Aliihoeflea sp.]
MTPRAIVVYCGVLMSISSFTVDITLPSFPDIVAELDTRYALVQWTIAIYMLAAGIAQLVWGPASDRYGRRVTLACGLAVYLAGCLLGALAPTIELLLAARALQGLGAAAAIVLARTILRDLFSGQELGRNLALASAIFAVGPILAPLVGAAIATPFGWRAIYGFLAIFGIGLIAALWRMPETIGEKVPEATRPAVLARRFKRLFIHPQSRRFLIVSAVIMSSMLMILSALPRLYEANFAVTGPAFAMFFALHGIGIIIGQVLNRRIIPVLGIVRAMLLANAILIVAALLVLVVTFSGLVSAPLLTAIMILFATSYLVVFSNGAAMVLDPHGDIAGFAASLYGFVSQIGGAAITLVTVVLVGDSLVAFGLALLAICGTSAIMVFDWQRRAAA